MILEPTGQISIIKAGQPLDPGILQGVLGVDDFEALSPQQGAED